MQEATSTLGLLFRRGAGLVGQATHVTVENPSNHAVVSASVRLRSTEVPASLATKPGDSAEASRSALLARDRIHGSLFEMNPVAPALNAAGGGLSLERSRFRPSQQSCHISVNGIR